MAAKRREFDEEDLPFDPERMPAPTFKAPDLIGTIEGWRTWQTPVELPRYGVPPKLMSVTHTYYWTPRQVNIATCDRGRGARFRPKPVVPMAGPPVNAATVPVTGMGLIAAAKAAAPPPPEHKHEVPVEDCTCGFYTARTLQHLLSMSYHGYDGEHNFAIIGRIANWGRVIVGTQGWRSQKAYPVTLFVPFEALRTHADALEEAYGVPVRPMNFLTKHYDVAS